VVKDIDVLGNYTNSFLALRDDFIEEHPQTTKTLISGLAKANHYLQTEPPAKVIALADKVAAEQGRPEDAESLKYWKSEGLDTEGGVIKGEFDLWNKWLEEEGEEPLADPSEAFTNEYNPYATKN
jgi:ABC-type nitrate/sulfonate/bicarbonate transport system substrate-binding protein